MNRKKLSLFISILILLFAFFTSRFPFYSVFFEPNYVGGDSYCYFAIAYQIKNNISTSFGGIGAGYPLLILLLSYLFENPSMALLYFQSALTLLVCLLFIYKIWKQFWWASLFSSIFLCLYITSNQYLELESYLLPDSIISNCFLLFTLLIYDYFYEKKNIQLFFASFLAAYTISIRSSSVFIIVICLLIFMYFYLRKREVKGVILFPLIFILFSISMYNYFTINTFTFITSNRIEKLLTPASIDEKKVEKIRFIYQKIPISHPIKRYKSTFNPDTVNYYYHFLHRNKSYQNINSLNLETQLSIPNYNSYSNVWSENMDVFLFRSKEEKLRLFWLTLKKYFLSYTKEHQLFYYSDLPRRYEKFYIKPLEIEKKLALDYLKTLDIYLINDIKVKQFALPHLFDSKVIPKSKNEIMINIKNSFWFKFFDFYNINFHKNIVRTAGWLVFYYILLTSSYIMLFFYPKDKNLIIITILFLFHLGSALIFSISNSVLSYSMWRYSFTTEFVYFLTPIFFFTFIISKFLLTKNKY